MSADDEIEKLKTLIEENSIDSAVLEDEFSVFTGEADGDLEDKAEFFEPLAEQLEKLEDALKNYSALVDFEIEDAQAVIQVGHLADDTDIVEYDVGVGIVDDGEGGEPALVFEVFVGDELYDFKNADQAIKFLTQTVGRRLLDLKDD